jgi:hypothetical protein
MFQIKVVEEIKTHVLYSVTASENRVVYEKMLKNTVGKDRPQMTTSRMRSAYCIPKAKNTHSEHVMFWDYFPN